MVFHVEESKADHENVELFKCIILFIIKYCDDLIKEVLLRVFFIISTFRSVFDPMRKLFNRTVQCLFVQHSLNFSEACDNLEDFLGFIFDFTVRKGFLVSFDLFDLVGFISPFEYLRILSVHLNSLLEVSCCRSPYWVLVIIL